MPPLPPHLLFRSASLVDQGPNQSGDAFLSGAQWSPDASCIATAQDGCVLLYDTPASALGGGSPGADDDDSLLHPALALGDPGSGEALYSFSFFPGFNSRAVAAPDATASSSPGHPCCLATSSRGQPVRLWDCLTGDVRAVYGASSAAAPEGGAATDALATPLAIAFSGDGAALAAGYPRGDLVLFDVTRPGRESEAAAVCCRPLKKKRRRKGTKEDREEEERRSGSGGDTANASSYAPDIRLPGPIGCVSFAPIGFWGGGGGASHVLAAGSYGGAVGVFDVRVAARRRRPAASQPGGSGGGGGADDAADLASFMLPTEFGRKQNPPRPPRITADAGLVAAAPAALSLAPVLSVDCGNGGVTQLLFAPPGSAQPLLFCGYRGFSDRIDGWDVRLLREPVVSIEGEATMTGPALSLRRRGGGEDDNPPPPHQQPSSRRHTTTPIPGRHQRIQFDVEPGRGRFLVTGSGGPDGAARVWGLEEETGAQPPPLLASFCLARDATVNAVAVCPADPSLIVVACGQRGYPLAPASEASSDEGDEGEEEAGGGDGDDLPGAGLALWRWRRDGEV